MSDEAKRFAFPGAPVRRCPQCLDEALNNWNGPRFFPATFVGYGGDADQFVWQCLTCTYRVTETVAEYQARGFA